MSTKLLDTTRKIGNVLRNSSSNKACISELLGTVSSLLMGNVYIASKNGVVFDCAMYFDGIDDFPLGSMLPEVVSECLGTIFSTKENISLKDLGLENSIDDYLIVTPVINRGERYANLFIVRANDPFDIEDVIVFEYCANILSILLCNEKTLDEDTKKRKKESIKSALNSLSIKEMEALKALLKELPKEEGLIITSKISKTYDITRSIIINCISKLESADILEERSMGAKGTYIKIKNNQIYDEVFKETSDI